MTPEETVAELLEGLDNDVRSFDKRAKGFLAALSAAGFVVVPREQCADPNEIAAYKNDMLVEQRKRLAADKEIERLKAMLSAYEERK